MLNVASMMPWTLRTMPSALRLSHPEMSGCAPRVPDPGVQGDGGGRQMRQTPIPSLQEGASGTQASGCLVGAVVTRAPLCPLPRGQGGAGPWRQAAPGTRGRGGAGKWGPRPWEARGPVCCTGGAESTGAGAEWVSNASSPGWGGAGQRPGPGGQGWAPRYAEQRVWERPGAECRQVTPAPCCLGRCGTVCSEGAVPAQGKGADRCVSMCIHPHGSLMLNQSVLISFTTCLFLLRRVLRCVIPKPTSCPLP